MGFGTRSQHQQSLPPPPWGQPSWPGNGDFAAQNKLDSNGKDLLLRVRDAWKDADIQGNLSRVSDDGLASLLSQDSKMKSKGLCFPTGAVVLKDLNGISLLLVGGLSTVPSRVRALTTVFTVLARGEYDARLAPNPNSMIILAIKSLPAILPRRTNVSLASENQ
jgi:hypothetical protein